MILKLAAYLYKLSALKFGPGTEWIPENFRQHKPFKEYSSENLIKEFSKYGIEDFKIPLPIDPSYNNDLAENLIIKIDTLIIGILDKLEEAEEEINSITNEIKNARLTIISLFDNQNFNSDNLTIKNNVYIGKHKFQFGSSIFKIYQAIKKSIEPFGINLPELDSIQEFKEYSKRPKNFYIVFSTKIQDLAGIGNRGIISCQSFDESSEDELSKNLQKRLVGTILSKYIGVIYLTSGSQYHEFGEKMLYRCLVRIVKDSKNNEIFIGLDAMLPEKNEIYLQVFQEELAKRSQVPVKILNKYESCQFEGLEDEESEITSEYSSYQEYPLAKSKMLEYLLNSDDPRERELGIKKLLPEDPRLIKFLKDPDEIIRNKAHELIPHDILAELSEEEYLYEE